MTATPKTFTAHGHTWTSHTPGDPNPCKPKTKPIILFDDHETSIGVYEAKIWDWSAKCSVKIIGWRYADEPQAKPVKTTKGAGTPEFRFTALMNALEERFPEAVDPASSDPPEPKLLAAIDSLLAKPASPWRPIAEAPRDGTRVLLFYSLHKEVKPSDTGVGFMNQYGDDARNCWWELEFSGRVHPTHYMPLPEPPSRP